MRWRSCRIALAVALLGLTPLAAQAEEKKPDKPEVGKPAPAIELAAANVESALPGAKGKKEMSLKDFAGKKNVVLWFYPKAMTGG